MRKKLLALAAVGLMATTAMTACDDSDESSDTGNGTSTGSTGEARVGVILPDTKSSTRWGNDDPKYLRAAFKAANVPVEIRNAQGSRAEFQRIGDSMINGGVKVLIIANLDSASGKAVLDKARAKKIPTIDYDRLTLNGGANYYVSFDNEEVGRKQAYGLQSCLRKLRTSNPVIAELNGSKTDNNASLFKDGYDEILQPQYDAAAYTKGPDQWVPDWDPTEAGKIFEQMLEQAPNIRGVLAANDGIANAVIKVLRERNLNAKVPVTGQDATLEGLQNILTGDQCVTIYKPLEQEAQTAALVAIDLFNNKKPNVRSRIKDPESGAYVPFASLEPRSIQLEQIKDVVEAGYVSEKQLCAGKYAPLCAAAGIGAAADKQDEEKDQ